MPRRCSLLFTLAFLACTHSVSAVIFLVTTNAGSGPGSLRQAILDANATPGPDAIHFSIGSGPQTIEPLTALPIITDTVTINGRTQPGFSNAPIITLSGGMLGGSDVAALQFECPRSSIIALVINRFFPAPGILIRGHGGHLIVGNYIGTDLTGTIGLPNESGIVVSNSIRNQIGLNDPLGRNLISANFGPGILLASSSSNVIQGNYIGTDVYGITNIDVYGRTNLGNHSHGIALVAGSSYNSIGGTSPSARNVVSGNRYSGISLMESPLNVIEGNYIGVNSLGTASLANGLSGIVLFQSSNTTIGGVITGARNLISGNAGYGVAIGSINAVVQGNYIGVDASGLSSVPNALAGIGVGGCADILIGGTAPGAGNLISGNRGGGVWMHATCNALVQGNLIGVDRTGSTPLGNGGHGVLLTDSADNVIGGAEAAARNIISGNNEAGVRLDTSFSFGNTIEGNYIGTDLVGATAVPNTFGVLLTGAPANSVQSNLISGNLFTGLYVNASSNVVVGNFVGTDATGTKAIPNGGVGIGVTQSGNTIGGTDPASRNIVSGNGYGIELLSSGAIGNVIQGNYIGLNVHGTTSLGNFGVGIVIGGGSTSTTVGGAEVGAANTISGNGNGGIRISNTGTTNNVVHGNRIGTDPTGNFGLPNHGAGVLLKDGASQNHIGGTEPGEGNVIAFNTADGVLVESAATRNPILANSIYSNGRLGINLKTSGEGEGVVTPNDVGDSDTGPNNLQNFPVITNVVYLSSSTIIQGYLRSKTNGSYALEFFANVATENTGFGEGQFPIGSIDVDTDESGLAQFAFVASASYSNQFFTATATDYTTGDTSEFSAAMGGIRITSIQRAGDWYHISFTTITNRNYFLQRTASLNPPISWSTIPLPAPIRGTGGIVTVSDRPPDRMRFYRVLQQ